MQLRRLLATTAVLSLTLIGCSSDDPSVEDVVDDATSAIEDVASEVADEASELASEASEAAEAASEAVDDESTEEGNDREGIELVATLTGEAEIPGPGDPGGSGSFAGTLSFLEASGELCYSLEAVGLTSEAVAAHIHEGAEGASGGVVLSLTPPTDGPAEECVDVEAGLATMLDQNPSDFYVNVHSAEFGDGAVRGQLSN